MAGGPELKPVSHAATTKSAWPEKLEAQFENVEIGISRTRGEYGGQPEIDEIADLFERQIASAKDYIYAESQYFTSRRIGQAICDRLAKDNPPEILIVHAEHAEGWLEQQAMDHARAELIRTLGHIDEAGRFGLYVPYTGEMSIYVHAKIMIIDDRILRIGSANMNNRSMGLDSECDVFVDCERPGNEHCSVGVAKLRHSLLAEHCGLEVDEVPALLARYGSMAGMIREIGTDRRRTLRRFDLPELNGVQEAIAESGLLDPERPDDLFEPYARGGLFRRKSLLGKIRSKVKKRKK
jgi:phosphatidylserine/phosphatidylglycerophosphate/cardiolipin synthase-like enzyme